MNTNMTKDLKFKENEIFLNQYDFLIDSIINNVFRSFKKYYNDLKSEGMIGLLEAKEKFNENYKLKFPTFAQYYIKKNIYKFLTNNFHISKVSTYVSRNALKIKKIKNDYYLKNNKEITNEELFELLDKKIGLKKIEEINQYLNYQNLSNDYDLVLIENYGDYLNKEVLYEKMNSILDDRERRFVALHLGLDGNKIKNFAEIGREYNLSRERVRQIFNRSIYKLKKELLRGSNL